MVWGVNSSDDAMSWRRNSWWEESNPLPRYDAATVALILGLQTKQMVGKLCMYELIA
jgi:hypothetical protein